jgi:hypothetical protein
MPNIPQCKKPPFLCSDAVYIVTATCIKFVTDFIFAPKIGELQNYLYFEVIPLQFENTKVKNVQQFSFQNT